jgi:hypothetical protein
LAFPHPRSQFVQLVFLSGEALKVTEIDLESLIDLSGTVARK